MGGCVGIGGLAGGFGGIIARPGFHPSDTCACVVVYIFSWVCADETAPVLESEIARYSKFILFFIN